MRSSSRRGHLPKASNLWRETDGQTLSGSKVSFERAFPTVADINVRVQGPAGNPRLFKKSEFGEWIDCTDDRCDGGGFSIGSIIRRMVAEGATTTESVEACRGQERNHGRSGGIRGPCTKTYKV